MEFSLWRSSVEGHLFFKRSCFGSFFHIGKESSFRGLFSRVIVFRGSSVWRVFSLEEGSSLESSFRGLTFGVFYLEGAFLGSCFGDLLWSVFVKDVFFSVVV